MSNVIIEAIERALVRAKAKGWNKTYWAIDIHDTIIKPNWQFNNIPTEFYPYAKEALQLITNREDITCLLYTCSHPNEIIQYLSYFEENDIYFPYVNENPEVTNETYGFYDQKPYFNVLLEDKAGFNADKDWKILLEYMKNKD